MPPYETRTIPARRVYQYDARCLFLALHASFRLEEFTNMMRVTPGIGIGLDDNCALQVRGQEYRFLATEEGAKAHKLFWEGEKLHHEYLDPTEEFHALSTLIS